MTFKAWQAHALNSLGTFAPHAIMRTWFYVLACTAEWEQKNCAGYIACNCHLARRTVHVHSLQRAASKPISRIDLQECLLEQDVEPHVKCTSKGAW